MKKAQASAQLLLLFNPNIPFINTWDILTGVSIPPKPIPIDSWKNRVRVSVIS